MQRFANWRNGVCRLLEGSLGFVLIANAAIHLNNPFRFLEAVLNYQIVYGFLANFVAGGLLHLQLVVGGAPVTGVMRRGSLLLAATLFTLFLFVQLSAVFRGLDIECGCFGNAVSRISWQSLGLTGLAGSIAVFLGILELRKNSLSPG
jgi:putative oxidoreductase